VAQYLAQAAAFCGAAGAGRRVIIVGGRGFIFGPLTRGLCEAPQGSVNFGRSWRCFPVERLRARLEAVDPACWSGSMCANPRRLARAD